MWAAWDTRSTRRQGGSGSHVDDVAKLVAAFKEMRADDGVTLDKLVERDWLLDLLLVCTPEEGMKKLDELIGVMGDGRTARAVRNALVIGEGLQPRGGVVDRRKWASDPLKKDRYFDRNERSHVT